MIEHHPWQQEAQDLIARHRERRMKVFWRWNILILCLLVWVGTVMFVLSRFEGMVE